MSEHITKPWDWSKNTDNAWLVPCPESAYLAERWQGLGYKSFLDLGCGLGRHSVYMAQKGFDVNAVDLSDYGVNHLREWAQKVGLTIKTAVSNMLTLPFEDNSFDCIMAFNVIYHTDTNGFIAVLEEIKRVLKPGGELFLTLISKNTFSFQHADQYKKVDENTLLRNEIEAGQDVPHFYVGILDVRTFFSDWSFELPPIENAEYKADDTDYCSKHWSLLLKCKKV